MDDHNFQCLVKCGKVCSENDKISPSKLESIKLKSKNWNGLDKFGTLYDETNWDNGNTGFYIHKLCYFSLSSSINLDKAIKRKAKCCSTLSFDPNKENVDDIERNFPSQKRLRSLGPLYDKNKCVWCMKGKDLRHPNRMNGTLFTISTNTAWDKFKRHPILIEEDWQLRDRLSHLIDSISDPFATSIMYHRSCWQKYITHRSVCPDDIMHAQNVSLLDARSLFFRHVDAVIFQEHEIRSLQTLLEDYKRIVGDFGYPVGDLKSSYIKELLIKEYHERIGFKERIEQNKSYLVYDVCGGGDYIESVLYSLKISDEQLIRNTAKRMSKTVKATTTPHWPPHVEDLEGEEEISELLVLLLTWLKHPDKTNPNINPATLSLASLITSYITGRRTISSINLGVTLHGMTRSKKVIETFHRYGFCISYSDILYLYDNWALRDIEASETCPQKVANNIPAIVVVDNDDFKIDTTTGNASGAHRTNVMFVQPERYEKSTLNNPSIKLPKKELSLKLKTKCADLTEVRQYITPHSMTSEPPVREQTEVPVNGLHPQRARSVIHALSRIDSDGKRPNPREQRVPAYFGAQSFFHSPKHKSRPYYHKTYNEPPNKSVIYSIMTELVSTMKEKDIPFAFLVGDMPTYKIIMHLKSENSAYFKDITPILGAFHQQLSYMYAIYKRFVGSGLADILVSAGVVVEGSVDHALRGKHYRRGLRCILLMREALLHKRIETVLEFGVLSKETRENLVILHNSTTKELNALQKAQFELENSKDITKLVQRVYQMVETDMGDFWISFLEMTDPLVQCIDALHSQNFIEYLSSTYYMLSGLMIYDNHDYGRWLPDYWAQLSTLPVEQMDFFRNHFSQSMIGLPYSCQPMDLWIETTMNLNSKLKSGWLNLLHNEKQLFSTIRNSNNVARVMAIVHSTINRKQQVNRKHAECQPSRMKKDEQAVQDIQACFTEFDANPFDVSAPTLRSLQTGLEACPKLIIDTQTALRDGQFQIETFLKERVFTKTKPLSEKIHKNKRLNFSKNELVSFSSKSQQNSVQMEKAGLASLVDISHGSDMIKLEKVLRWRVTEECLSLFNVNGSMHKTCKSIMLQKFLLEPVSERIKDYISLVDMGLILHLATPSHEDRESQRRDGLQYRWIDYLNKICHMIMSRHIDASVVFLVNDMYNNQFSIKDDEHERRAAKFKSIPNVFPKPGDKFPAATEFKKFMMCSNNKLRLQKLVRENIRKYAETVKTTIMFCDSEGTINLNTNEQNETLSIRHAEADTILLSIYASLRANGNTKAVIIDSEDTDVYVQAAYVSHNVVGELFIKRKSVLVNCQDMLPEIVAKIIIPLHIISGSDHTSAFFGHGKKKLLTKCMNDPECVQLLQNVGRNLHLQENIKSEMRQFVIRKVYGETDFETCGHARASKWSRMKKKRTARLPPDEDSLNQHLERTNFISYCQLNYHLMEHPSPIGHGWDIINGKCRPVRHSCPALPPNFDQLYHQNEYDSESCSDESESSSDESESELGDSSDSDN